MKSVLITFIVILFNYTSRVVNGIELKNFETLEKNKCITEYIKFKNCIKNINLFNTEYFESLEYMTKNNIEEVCKILDNDECKVFVDESFNIDSECYKSDDANERKEKYALYQNTL
ncbi:hypothetical protein BCR36DRAFT_374175 [Piromyces finnis]|uniref:DUF19 domain-containing protein n=1 Tax=Piromyces finnis TaxID=1754191 RepID=A0A1Y1UZ61_9FUNG|nr:hypothetical protein BCR36DRAFT_374175 [Piromyces finnis]|eukprot:ORX42985.1 hypothetical protein BCR36DRAFT_374175 [Piromyces finnis]